MTYHFRPEDMIFIAEYFVLSKRTSRHTLASCVITNLRYDSTVYAISLLATCVAVIPASLCSCTDLRFDRLNTRKIIRGRGTDNKSGGTQDNTTALTGSVHLAPSALQKSKAQTAHANDWSYPPSQVRVPPRQVFPTDRILTVASTTNRYQPERTASTMALSNADRLPTEIHDIH